MLTLSNINNIKSKLLSIDSVDKLSNHDKQLYELLKKHYTLFVGCDVSKNDFAVNIKNASSETIYGGKFLNHHAGFCQFYEALNRLNKSTDFTFQVAVECTGPYHKALIQFLQSKEISVFLYNAQTARHLAKAHLKEKKTDKIDAGILALLLIDGNFPVSQTDAENEFLEIRSFSRRSDRYGEQIAKAKTRLKDELIQASKGILIVFPQQAVFNKAPMELLKKYPLPMDRLSAGIEEVTRILKESSNNKYGQQEAYRLLSFDKDNQADTRLFPYFRQSIRDYIDEIEYYEKKRQVYTQEIDLLTSSLEEAQNLLSLTGCGPTLMPVILGEVGDIKRFSSAKHFAGYAGFVPVECESGPQKGEKHIKNGASARLSHACFMIANCIRRYDERLKSLYIRVKARHVAAGKTKGGAHLIANCAVAREVSVLIYNILKYSRKYFRSKDEYKAYRASLV